MSAIRSNDQLILELGQALAEKPEGESLLQEGSKTCILLNEIKQIYRASFSADVYAMSANAVTETGVLFNVDGVLAQNRDDPA